MISSSDNRAGWYTRLLIHPHNGMVSIKWPMRSVVVVEKFWAVLEVVASAPRTDNDLPVAEYPTYAFVVTPNALAPPTKAGTCPSKLVIVPVFAERYMS